MTDKELQAMKNTADMCKRVLLTEDIPFDRLQEICNAERDGRLVVLPCKIGDKAYQYSSVNSKMYEDEVFNITLDMASSCFNIHLRLDYGTQVVRASDMGKTVFLTREEAKQALKGGAE